MLAYPVCSMTVEVLAAWLLSIMLASIPPGRSLRPAEAKESVEQGRARYAAIARALAEVSLDPKEKPLFSGKDARSRTAALMLAISFYESHWRRDVDLGLGQRRSRYYCMMQIGAGKGKTMEGWTGQQLVESRDRCFRAGLHILQRGQRVCAKSKDKRAFVYHYASGYCDRGRKAVAKRWRLLDRWLARFKLKQAGAQRPPAAPRK